MRPYHLLLFMFFVSASCNEESVSKTQAQITAKKLKAEAELSRPPIARIIIMSIYDGSIIFSGSSYVIKSDGFIMVTSNGISTTYNLGELKSYKIISSTLYLYY